MGPPRRPNIDRLREIALSLPETHEEVTWGDDLNIRVGKKIFCFPGETALTVKADPLEREALLADERVRLAAYLGRFGWVTLEFGTRPDWTELSELVVSSYCLIAPKRLAALARTTRPG
jgi:predicted DNA-binding protein (MmcQ/YjbR family)